MSDDHNDLPAFYEVRNINYHGIIAKRSSNSESLLNAVYFNDQLTRARGRIGTNRAIITKIPHRTSKQGVGAVIKFLKVIYGYDKVTIKQFEG